MTPHSTSNDEDVRPVSQVVMFPTTVEHPEFGRIRIVDYKRPFEYMDAIFAYVDAETGEYGGMFMEDETPVKVIEE